MVSALIAFAILVFVAISGSGTPAEAGGTGIQPELAITLDGVASATPAAGDEAETCGAGPGCISAMLEVDGVQAPTGASETPPPGPLAGAHAQAGPPPDHPPIFL